MTSGMKMAELVSKVLPCLAFCSALKLGTVINGRPSNYVWTLSMVSAK